MTEQQRPDERIAAAQRLDTTATEILTGWNQRVLGGGALNATESRLLDVLCEAVRVARNYTTLTAERDSLEGQLVVARQGLEDIRNGKYLTKGMTAKRVQLELADTAAKTLDSIHCGAELWQRVRECGALLEQLARVQSERNAAQNTRATLISYLANTRTALLIDRKSGDSIWDRWFDKVVVGADLAGIPGLARDVAAEVRTLQAERDAAQAQNAVLLDACEAAVALLEADGGVTSDNTAQTIAKLNNAIASTSADALDRVRQRVRQAIIDTLACYPLRWSRDANGESAAMFADEVLQVAGLEEGGKAGE